MIERTIFRNIQHIPRVWGVTYPKLFASIGVGLLTTTAGFALSAGASALSKVFIIALGAVLTLSFHGVCLWMERQDALDRDLTFLKSAMNAQSMSLQMIHIQGDRH
jgi:hypothetical protein